MTIKRLRISLLFLIIILSATAQDKMKIENLNGPVTQTEIASFKNYMSTQVKNPDNTDNAFVYGTTGVNTEALGMMYEISKDIEILNMMIDYADHMLQARNNPTTGRIVWSGKRELCWPNKKPTALDSAYTGTENGDVIAHIVYCAKLIIQNKKIWAQKVPVGDPYKFGSTYMERARTYISECNKTMDSFIIPHFVKKDTYDFTSPESEKYGIDARSKANVGKPVAWNQQTMLAGGFQRIAECLELLKEDPERVKLYHNIVGVFISSFQKSLLLYQKNGFDCYKWSYSASDPTYKYVEDVGHGGYDLLGLMRAYESNRYNIKPETLKIFANTVQYVMSYEDGTFAGRVDGSPGKRVGKYLGGSYIKLSVVSPEIYDVLANAAMHRVPTNPNLMASILWMKDQRYKLK